MRAMKDSGIEWIGAIPQDWELRKIKTNFDIIAGATPKSGEASFWDGDIPWITPADYTTEGIYVSAGHKSITHDGLNSCATSLIPEGSIIFSKRAPVGLVAINSNPLCTNQGCLSCVPKDLVDAKYFYYVMSIYGEQFDLFASGTTFKEISADAFANFKLPYPDFETQKQIASFLDTKCAEIDALIAAKEKTNALLKERRQSIIYEAVTKGLDPTAPMKDSGVEWIGKIPERWSVTKIGFLFNTIGSGTTPTSSDGSYYDGEYNWLQTGDLNDSIIETTEKTITDLAIKNYSVLNCYSVGSLVIAMYGATIGKLGILGVPCYTNQACCVLDDPQNADTKYVYYWLLGYRQVLINLSLGGGQPNISQSIIRSFRVCLPPKNEQEAIAKELDNEVSSLDHIMKQNKKTIQLLKEYRQSLIYEAVTGKIEL